MTWIVFLLLAFMGLGAPDAAVAQRLGATPQQGGSRAAPAAAVIRVTEEALSRDPATGLLDVTAPLPPRSRAVAPPRLGEAQIRLETMLAGWIRRGRAAGNVGDIYDNRDRGHSDLPAAWFPGITRSVYDKAATDGNLDYGLNAQLRFPAPTFGNSSTALTGNRRWRSQPRHAMTAHGFMPRLAALYWSNHLYVYPEHRDHDPERGDLFPAAIPYLITTQGSSGSDRPFLRAIGLIMAAYRPETKAALTARGHLAAVTGMILRRGMRGIETDEDYLSGLAHPSVFEAEKIDLGRKIVLANALMPDRLPPVARLRVVSAPQMIAGVNAFADGVAEALFITDAAVGWVARAMIPSWRFVLEAQGDGPAVTHFHWKVLRGDADRITIRPLDPTGTQVEVIIPWHDPYPVPGRADMHTQRVDIGLFAEADGVLSPPAFFSLAFPPREERVHAPDGRLLAVTHAPHGRSAYADPLLYPSADWSDTFHYDEDKRLLGWTREIGGATQAFTRHGLLIDTRDDLGRPLDTRMVRYPVQPGTDGQPARVVPTISEARRRYVYSDAADSLGMPIVPHLWSSHAP